MAVADVSRWAPRAIRKASWRTAVLKAGFAAITGVVVTTARYALAIFAASIVTTARIVAAAFLAQARFTNTPIAAACVLRAGLAALIFDTALSSKAIRIITTASKTGILDTTLTILALSVFTTAFNAAVLQTDLSTGTRIVVRTPSNALAISAEGTVATGHHIVVTTTPGLAVVPFADRTHPAV